MANENYGSTVLHEHRKIVTFRHLLALVNFIAILAGTVITRHFVLIKGASENIVLIINILCIINLLQIILCVFDYIIKVAMGKYSKALVSISYIVGVIWFIAVFAEFALGSYELGDIRIDLLAIAALQFVSAIIAYVIWPHIDYATLRSLTHKKVREDIEKKIKKAKGGVAKYVTTCLLMVTIQIGMLLAYKLPASVYDLFSEARQLQYQLSDDGESYEVTGIYLGTSNYVSIPLVYNNKPVTKIRDGALSTVQFAEINKVEKIDIGVYVTDENGVTSLESNIETIESGAIKNNKIKSLTLPASVVKIEDGAINSKSLRVLTYEARSDFSYSYLNCESLNTITFSGLDAGKIVSLEGMDKSSVNLFVEKDIYNNYREKNNEYMSSIKPILEDDEFVIDFYTGYDYYIESIICKDGEKVEIGYMDLKNDKYVDKVAPSVDTLAYFSNRHETGTRGSKNDSAFRGWYYDSSFTEECLFKEDGKVSFTKSTSVYARWIDEYTGTLDWGTFHPDAQPSTLYWTDEDIVFFPVIEDRDGFEDGIMWSLEGKQVTSSQNISESVTINGRWLFDTPTADIKPSAKDSSDLNFNISTDGDSVTFTYDELQELTLEAQMNHKFDKNVGFKYVTEWRKADDSSFINMNKAITAQNVPESGVYILRVTAVSPHGDESFTETRINVTINKKNLNIGNVKLNDKVVEYDAQQQQLEYTGEFVDDRILTTYIYTYYDVEGNEIIVDEGVKNAGTYKVKAIFEKNNAQEAQNYTIKELEAKLTITPCMLNFIGWSADELVYNTTEQGVYLNVSGVRANDYVEIIYTGNVATKAGTYVAKATGVSNPNYSLSEIDAESKCTHSWAITPKEVSVKEWKLDGSVTSTFVITYNGEVHTLEAVPDGVYASDLGVTKFIYDGVSNTVSATDANRYTAKIIGVDNPNYSFTAESTREWEIEKRNLTVVYDSVSDLVYNGKTQSINAIISGIVPADLDKFTREKLTYLGKSDSVNVGELIIDNNTVIVPFSAKNAAEYILMISGIDGAADVSKNYKMSSEYSHALTIMPKSITLINDGDYTYNGKLQALSVKVGGIAPEDIANVAFDSFTVEGAVSGAIDGDCYSLILNAKDAGSYEISLSAFNNSNYSVSEMTQTVVIKKQQISIDWFITDKSSIEDAKVILDAAEVPYNYAGYDISIKVNNAVNGENVEIILNNALGIKNAANYVTEATLGSADVNKNYSFENTSISWKITPMVIDFTWKINGTFVNVGNDNIPTYVYTGNEMAVVPQYTLLGDDVLNISYGTGAGDILQTNASELNYKVTVSDLGNTNYAIGSNSSFEWKINPKQITVNWLDTNVLDTVYNGEAHGLKFTADGLIEVNDRYLSLVINNGSANIFENYVLPSASSITEHVISGNDTMVNAGKYAVYFASLCKNDGSVDTNYTVKCESLVIDIAKAPIVLSGWKYINGDITENYTPESVLVYNAENYTFFNTISTVLCSRAGEVDDVFLSYNYASNKNAGTHSTNTYLSGEHALNYYIVDGSEVEWRIEPKVITVEWYYNEFVFNGYTQTQQALICDGILPSDDVILVYDHNSYTNAGDYTTTASFNTGNYVVEESCATYEWSIAPKPISLTWNYNTFVYNGGVQTPQAYYSNIKASTYEIVESKDVGTYTIKALTLNNSNYVIANDGSDVHTYQITPRTVTFSWGFDGNKSNAKNYTYDGTTKVLTAYVSNICGSDVVDITYDVSSQRDIHDAKTYTATVIGITNSNYQLTVDSQNVQKTITVSKRDVSISWGYDGKTTGAGNYTYDGTTKSISAYISNICAEDKLTINYTGMARSLHNAGEYSFTVASITGEDVRNYNLSSPVTKNITVSAKELRFEWYFGAGKTNSAANFVFNGETYILNAVPTAATLVSGDSITLVYDKVDRSLRNAGTYTVEVIDIEGEDASNYRLPSSSYKKKSITVSQQVVTIIWSESTEFTYNGTEQQLVATVKGQLGENFTTLYKNSVNSKIDAGTYTLEVEGFSGTDAENYKMPTDGSQKTTLVIKPQSVVITWSDESGKLVTADKVVTYDGDTHSLNASVKGVDGNTVSFSYTSSNAFTDAGSYTVTLQLNNSNYTLSGITYQKNLTIEKQSVAISWIGAGEYTYDGAPHSLIATVKGKDDDKTVNFSYNTSTESITNVGELTRSVYSLSNDNYTLVGAVGNMSEAVSIVPQPVKITWNGGGEFVYDGVAHYLTATVRGLNDGVSVTPKYNNSTSSITSVGGLTRSVSSLGNTNYTLVGAEGELSMTLTIVPQPVKIVWDGAGEYEYDGQMHSLTATVTGISNGNTVSLTVTYNNPTSYITNVGSLTRTVSINNSNYTLVGADGDISATVTIVEAE